MVSFLAEVEIFIFWPRTMDYSQAFCSLLMNFHAIHLLLTIFMFLGHVCWPVRDGGKAVCVCVC